MNSRALRFFLVGVLLTVALAALIAGKVYTLRSGATVVLKVAPRDPRDLFRGDYVVLQYEIGRLVPAELEGDDEFARGDTVYVRLQTGGQYAYPLGVYHNWPEIQPGEVVLKGEVTYLSSVGWKRKGGSASEWGAYTMNVRYGIENYFVPEGEGKALENLVSTSVVSLRVAVDKNGKAGILAVLVDGEERYQESLY